MVSFSQELERFWGRVMDLWAVSKSTAQKRSLWLRAGLEHSLSQELKETRKKPLWPSACFASGNFFAFCHIDHWAFITWSVAEKAAWEGSSCCGLAVAVPRTDRRARSSKVHLACLCPLHPPAQSITDKLSSWFKPSKSWQQLKNHKNLEKIHLGCLLFGFQVL